LININPEEGNYKAYRDGFINNGHIKLGKCLSCYNNNFYKKIEDMDSDDEDNYEDYANGNRIFYTNYIREDMFVNYKNICDEL